MKFEYEVTNGECVDKKKFGGQNLKKRQTVRRVLHTWHTANVDGRVWTFVWS